jgi:hypothetical protein
MYSNIDTIEQLNARVQVLEQQRAAEWKEMKDRVNEQYERLKPANLIKNAFGDLSDNLNLNQDGDILREGAALASGMIVNAVMSGSKNKALKKWLSVALFSVATYFITRHREDIVNAANKVVNFITDKLNSAQTRRAARKAREEAEEEDLEEAPDFPDEDMDEVLP